MTPATSEDHHPVAIRPMRSGDEEHIVALLSRTLGWKEDQRHRELFAWKHQLNPFGTSPGWVAEDDQGVAGFRTLMRWEFLREGRIVRAVRAVDTATDPRAQGRGIFRALTLKAIDDMTAEGTAFVFNTPNPQSAPGYLSMGWREVGRLPVRFRPSGPRVLPRLLVSRTYGDLWSTPTSVGEPAAEVLSDTGALSELLGHVAATGIGNAGIQTHRTPEFLQWRYGHCPVGYRAMLGGSRIEDGLLIFRIRRRGAAQEVVIADTITTSKRTSARLHRAIVRGSGTDYALALGSSRPRFWPPVPRSGPLLTWRPLSWTGPPPTLSNWHLCTGDVELF